MKVLLLAVLVFANRAPSIDCQQSEDSQRQTVTVRGPDGAVEMSFADHGKPMLKTTVLMAGMNPPEAAKILREYINMEKETLAGINRQIQQIEGGIEKGHLKWLGAEMGSAELSESVTEARHNLAAARANFLQAGVPAKDIDDAMKIYLGPGIYLLADRPDLIGRIRPVALDSTALKTKVAQNAFAGIQSIAGLSEFGLDEKQIKQQLEKFKAQFETHRAVDDKTRAAWLNSLPPKARNKMSEAIESLNQAMAAISERDRIAAGKIRSEMGEAGYVVFGTHHKDAIVKRLLALCNGRLQQEASGQGTTRSQ